MLHSAFWHHGAGDLDLPIWWASILDPIATVLSSPFDNGLPRSRSIPQTQRDFGMLEFLYPPKTLALMKRLSKLGGECLFMTRSQVYARSYSSARNQSTLATEATGVIQTMGDQESATSKLLRRDQAAAGLIGEKSELHDLQTLRTNEKDKPLRDLKRFFRRTLPFPKDGKSFEKVWQLYLQLDNDQRSPELQRQFLNILSFSTRQEERVRSALLLDKVNQDAYWKEILQQLHAGDFEDAVSTHNYATKANTRNYIGSDVLLAHALQRREWTAALEIFNARMASFALQGSKSESTSSEPSIWGFVERLPNLEELMSAYLDKPQLESDKRLGRDFLRHLASCVLMNGRLSQLDLRRTLIQKLHALDLTDSGFYEAVIKTIRVWELPSGRMSQAQYTEVRKYFFDLYYNYRKSLRGRPQKDVLYNVLGMLVGHKSFGKVEVSTQSIEDDLREIDGPIAAMAVTRMLTLYARSGDVVGVNRCFDEFSKRMDGPLVPRALIAVHAKRAEAIEAQQQFDRISNELGQIPDLICWNTLLDAYVQAEDLEGAMQCLNRMLNTTDLRLDDLSFAPVLQLFAERGEPELVIEYLETAKERDVRLNANLLSCLVLAHIKNDNLPAAEEALEALVNAKAKGELEDSLTKVYNYILTAYATRRDIDNVLRYFKSMQKNDVASDSSTYGALIQVMCLTHQTAAAQKMLEKVMPDKGIPVLPFHYSLIIAGYHRQDQRSKALAMLGRMKEKGIKADASVRTAYLRARSFRNVKDFTPDEVDDLRRERWEAKVQKVLNESDVEKCVTQGPRLGLSDLNPQNASDAYFETLLMNYGWAVDSGMVQKITEQYEAHRAHKPGPDGGASLRVLGALIFAHFYTGDHAKVQDYWTQYAATVAGLFRVSPEKASTGRLLTAEQALSSGGLNLNLESTAPSSFFAFENVKIPPSRRSIFSQPLVPYIRSLAMQQSYDLVYATIYSLLNAGFTFDNQAWNAYIKHLAQSRNPAHIITAFRACEEKLMPSFPGWIDKARQVKYTERRSRYGRSFEYMKVRFGREQRWPGLLMPQFDTLLELRGVLEKIEQAESQGLEGDESFEWTPSFAPGREGASNPKSETEGRKLVLTVHGLGLIAPLTVKAVKTIPEIAVTSQRFFPNDETSKWTRIRESKVRLRKKNPKPTVLEIAAGKRSPVSQGRSEKDEPELMKDEVAEGK